MARAVRLITLSSALVMLAPSTAFAATGAIPRGLDLGVGVVALVLAGIMLLDVLALRRVAAGAAFAEHITFVMAAVASLAASVLVEWMVRFSPDLISESVGHLGSQLLVIAAMAFFALYFFRVRRAMVRFLRRGTSEEALIRAQMADDGSAEANDDAADGDAREVAGG